MASGDMVYNLRELGDMYDSLAAWGQHLAKIGKLSDPSYPAFERVYNQIGPALARVRDAVATAILRQPNGEPWASLALALPILQYNKAEYLGDASPLTKYAKEKRVEMWQNPPTSIREIMGPSFPKWTYDQAKLIAGVLPPTFDAWARSVFDAETHALYLVGMMIGGREQKKAAPPPPSTNLAPSSSPASGPASSSPASGTAATDAGGGSSSKGKGAILAALALGALLFMPRKRRRST